VHRAQVSNISEIGSQGWIYYVDRPVYILSILTIHIGHILVDLLESVYYNMMSNYGEIRRDAILVFSVAGKHSLDLLHAS